MNLKTMEEMCDRVGWIDHGKLRMIGEPAEVVAAYRQENS